MRFKYLFFLIEMLCAFNMFAQTVDYNRIILPSDVKDLTTEELLIQLAWNNHPDNLNLENEVDLRNLELRSSRLDWIGLFGVTGNLNEYNINELTGGSDLISGFNYYPRYNFYVNLPFSRFYEIPINNKINKKRVSIAINDINSAKIELRSRVLNSYSDYLTSREILKVRRDFEEIANSNFIVAEEQFKQGSLNLEDYYIIYRNFQNQRIERINAENAYKHTINDLESLIGISLNEVIQE